MTDRRLPRQSRYLLRAGPVLAGFSVAMVVAACGSERSGQHSTRAGSLDVGFGRDGKVVTDFDGAGARGLAIRPDGTIIVAVADSPRFGLAQYARDGSLDRSFGRGGKVVTDRAEDLGTDTALQPDGTIVLTGSTSTNGEHNFAVGRFTRDGMPDHEFGEAGKVVTDLGSTTDFAEKSAVQEDGKIVVAGSIGDVGSVDIALVRYTRDGALDQSFGRGGKVVTDLGSDDYPYDIAVQPDGKIVVAGQSGPPTSLQLPPGVQPVPGSIDFALVRYTKDGAIDRRFGRSGRALIDLGSDESGRLIGLQPDGKIVVAGDRGNPLDYSEDFALLRYTRDGVLDRSFGLDGKVVTDLGASESAVDIVLQPDGKIVVAGDSSKPEPGPWGTDDIALVRYTRNGELDRSFGRGGKVVTDLGSDRDSVGAVDLQDDGKIVVAGWSNPNLALVRYLGTPNSGP